MKKEFAKKIKEALLSALPIILIVLILHFTKIAPISNQQDFIIFLICSIFFDFGHWIIFIRFRYVNDADG